MTDKEGTLHLQASGRWAILRTGREPFELTSGAVFRVEVPGKEGLQQTRPTSGHYRRRGAEGKQRGSSCGVGDAPPLTPRHAGARSHALGVEGRGSTAIGGALCESSQLN